MRGSVLMVKDAMTDSGTEESKQMGDDRAGYSSSLVSRSFDLPGGDIQEREAALSEESLT